MDTMLEKLPPQSINAEMAVLGSMLIETQAVDKIVGTLDEKHFYKDTHRHIFKAIRTLYEHNKAIDLTTVSEELKRNKLLSEIGGASYLISLINAVSTAANVEDYATIVQDKFILRNLINIGTNIVTESYRDHETPKILLDRAEQEIFSIRQQGSSSGFISLDNLLHDTLERIEAYKRDGKHITGVATGYKQLDELTAGFQPGNLILIAARPSAGKTALCLNIAEHVAVKEKRPVGIFSLEMSMEEIALRMVCSMAQLNMQEIRQGIVSEKTWPKLTTAAAKLSQSPIFLCDLPSMSILDLCAQTRRLTIEKKPAMIMIDYIQLLSGSSSRSNDSRQQEISEISRMLKGLARSSGIPVVALSQLSRRPEERDRGGKPRLSDLRESGALEQDADMVIFIYREEMYKKEDEELAGKAKLIIEKQRNGPTGSIDLNFIKEYAKFVNPA